VIVMSLCTGGIGADFRREFAESWAGIEARQLMKRDVIEGMTDCDVDALPPATDPALTLDTAAAGRSAALGNGDGAFENIEYLGCGNLFGTTRKAVSALRTAGGDHQARALQSFENLAYRR
jgi:hypothetical protein